MSQPEVDHLLARFLEEETIPYFQSKYDLIAEDDDSETDTLIRILSLLGMDKKDIMFFLLRFLEENAQEYLNSPEIDDDELEDIMKNGLENRRERYS